MKYAPQLEKNARGFSMVEMLVAAFIMAIGLLGLASLQALSIRTAGTGARLTDAVRIGELVLESVSSEGLQSYLGERYQDRPVQPMYWIGGGNRTIYYGYRTVDAPDGYKGSLVQLPDANGAIYTVSAEQADQAVLARGKLTRITVQVTFTEAVVNGAPVNRTVQLVREVAHV